MSKACNHNFSSSLSRDKSSSRLLSLRRIFLLALILVIVLRSLFDGIYSEFLSPIENRINIAPNYFEISIAICFGSK